MGREIRRPEFHGDTNIKYFLDLCKKASFTGVHWAKFKVLDQKGKKMFADFSISALSLHHRRLYYGSQGICWQCGVEEAGPNGYCTTCYSKIQELNNKRYAKIVQLKLKNKKGKKKCSLKTK